jgi:hypothetical protein
VDLVNNAKGDYYIFLRELSLLSSELCSISSRNAIEKLSRRYASLTTIDFQTKLPIFPDTDSLEFWKNLSVFACSTVFGDSVSLSMTKEKAYIIRHPRELYDMILPHIKSSNEHQITYAIFAIGSVHESCLETLFELMNDYEFEAFGDKKRKQSKKRDILRIQISRIYSRIADSVSDTIFRDKEFIKDKFLNFISEQLNFLKSPSQMYLLDFQMLRWNLFIILTKISRKFFYYPPPDGLKTLESSLKKELIQYIILWTGFGEESKKREQMEHLNLDLAVKQIKTDEEKIQFENMFKRHSEKIQEAAIDALCSLLHGLFRSSKQDGIKQWSAQNRGKIKSLDNGEKALLIDKNLTIARSPESQKIRSNPDKTTITLGGLFKGGILDTIRKDSTGTITSKDLEDNLGIVLFQWFDEALLSQYPATVELVIQGIANLLEGNHEILDLLIDQCYTCNEEISNGYFHAIVKVFSKIHVQCSPATMLSLIIYKSRANSKNIRDSSFKLLNVICKRHFDDGKTQNYSYFVSSNFLDSYENIQMNLSTKLATDHPSLSTEILQEWFIRLAFITDSDQRAILSCLTPWISNIQLSEKEQIKLPTGVYESKDVVLSCLYDISYTYFDTYPKECQDIWEKLAKKTENSEHVVNFLIVRCTHYENSFSILQIAQRITRCLSLVSANECVDVLIKEFISFRDNKKLMSSMEAFYGNPTQAHDSSNRSSYDSDKLELFSTTETALCLLVGVAYHQKEALSDYLPLILQIIIIHLDHRQNIIIENSQLLLVNLIHRFVINELPHINASVSESQQMRESQNFIQFILEKSSLWSNDLGNQKINSMKNVDYLVNQLLNVFKNEKNFKVRWGDEALKWTSSCKKLHPVMRSYQIYKTIKAPLTRKAIIELTKSLSHYLTMTSNVSSNNQPFTNNIPTPPVEYTPRNLGLGSFSRVHTELCAKEKTIINEIISTIREIVVSIDSTNIILFPQLFWICVSMLTCRFNTLYTSKIVHP